MWPKGYRYDRLSINKIDTEKVLVSLSQFRRPIGNAWFQRRANNHANLCPLISIWHGDIGPDDTKLVPTQLELRPTNGCIASQDSCRVLRLLRPHGIAAAYGQENR